jgi:simple sugar transport system permease protein
MMLMGAFAAAITALFTGNPWLGVLGGAAMGMMVGLLHAVMCIKFKANQTVIGTGINIMAMGVPPMILHALWGNPGSSPTVPALKAVSIPGLVDIPVIGNIIGTQNPLTYFALLMVPAATFFLFKTKTGLRIRAVGEHPRAADTVGVNVFGLQYMSLMVCGILAGIGGAYLSLGQISMFVKGMTAGRGFMALAAMIFGKWTPIGVLMASMLFGLADSLQMSIQVKGWAIPTDFLLSIPYILTIIALAGFVGKAVAPKQVGKPYIKE